MKVLKIFGVAILLVAGFFLFQKLAVHFFRNIATVPGFASVVIFVVMTVFFIKCDVSWKNSERTAIVICFCAFVGALFDISGNYFYNLPLEWLFASEEDVGARVLSYMNYFVVLIFRYIEYLLIGSFIALVVMPFTKKIKMDEKIVAQDIDK